MSILIDSNTTITPQGMAGATGAYHTLEGLAYGTKTVGGVTPGNRGSRHFGWPAYAMMAKAILATIHAEGGLAVGAIRPDSILIRSSTGVASRSGALVYKTTLQSSSFGQMAMEATDMTVRSSPSFWAEPLRKRSKSQ